MKTKVELAVLKYLECYHSIIDYNELDYKKMIELLLRFIQARESLHTPSKLYKFRTCNKQNLRTLEQNCIWMPPADSFIDISDCNIYTACDIKTKELKRIETKQGYLTFVKILNNSLEKLNIDLTSEDKR